MPPKRRKLSNSSREMDAPAGAAGSPELAEAEVEAQQQ